MSLPNYMGCLMEFCKSVSLYYTKMCFKILNISDASQSLSRESTLYIFAMQAQNVTELKYVYCEIPTIFFNTI
jgi:hypothetical protein